MDEPRAVKCNFWGAEEEIDNPCKKKNFDGVYKRCGGWPFWIGSVPWDPKELNAKCGEYRVTQIRKLDDQQRKKEEERRLQEAQRVKEQREKEKQEREKREQEFKDYGDEIIRKETITKEKNNGIFATSIAVQPGVNDRDGHYYIVKCAFSEENIARIGPKYVKVDPDQVLIITSRGDMKVENIEVSSSKHKWTESEKKLNNMTELITQFKQTAQDATAQDSTAANDYIRDLRKELTDLQRIWINLDSHYTYQDLVNKYEVDFKSGYYTYDWRRGFDRKK